MNNPPLALSPLSPSPSTEPMEWKTCVEIFAQDIQAHEDALGLNQLLFDVSTWCVYLDAIDDWLISTEHRFVNHRSLVWYWRDFIGRRAVTHLPRSYKLWKRHWESVMRNPNTTPRNVIECMEQAVITLSAFPRVWMAYLNYLCQTFRKLQEGGASDGPNTEPISNTTAISVTFLRRCMNRALQALPVTQHEEKLWRPVLLPFLLDSTVLPIETRARMLQRYCFLQPRFAATDYGPWCEQHGQWGRAAVAYQTVLGDITLSDQGHEELWQAFGNLCIQHSQQVEAVGVRWEDIFRTALQQATIALQPKKKSSRTAEVFIDDDRERKTNQWKFIQGMLYNWLATAWVRRGAFELARSAYEEGLAIVATVRDFSILYEAYLQFEEGLLEHSMASMEQFEGSDEAEGELPTDTDDWDILLQNTATSPLVEMELAISRAEHLTRRRPLLLNAVMLRQDPNNIGEWLQRSKLYSEQQQPRQSIHVLEEALSAVHVSRPGRSKLVLALVDVYTRLLDDVDSARDVLQRTCKRDEVERGIIILQAEDLAACWAIWIEVELQHENWDDALSLARQSVARPKKAPLTNRMPNLTKSLKLWDLLLDLEESLGTIQTTKDAYNRALEIHAATVQHVLNYAEFLREHKYFEESFAAYEKGLELFAFPHPGARLLWKAYLDDFLGRYKDSQLERARDLFERCLKTCPAEHCAEFFAINGKFEEEHGLTKRALNVYHDMCQRVPTTEKLAAYQLYILKTRKYLGLTATREVYQEAIEALDDHSAAMMCIDFVKMEASLHQYDRARAILTYGAQTSDPRRLPEFWKVWNDFEVAHGSEETFREMLRVKRNVEALFSTINYNAIGMSETVETLSQEEAMRLIATQEGVEIPELSNTAVIGFISSKRAAPESEPGKEDNEQRESKLRRISKTSESEQQDTNEIDIDEIDTEIQEAAEAGPSGIVHDISTKGVPLAVLGNLARRDDK